MVSKRFYAITSIVVLVYNATVFGQADLLPSIPKGTISVGLNPIANISSGDYGISAPGDPNRLFVVEQKGQILILENGSILPTPALDIQSLVAPPLVTTSVNDERGLLGLAFHPGYNTPSSPGYRTLYTFDSQVIPSGGSPTFAAPNGVPQTYEMVINEWKRDAINSNIIDPASRREVLSYGKNATNHNGGTIAFGPDGYLYLGTGDGGNSYDSGANGNSTNNSHVVPTGNAQVLTNPLGKMLRIDPLAPALNASLNPISTNGAYRIPADNPFAAAGQLNEIYAYGLRNPYRFAFDDRLGGTGDLIAADVGQGNIEEIDRIIKGGNYGWVQKEGEFLVNRVLNPDGTLAPGGGTIGARRPELSGSLLIDPIKGVDGTLQYDHQDGISITGGFVYRGSLIPELIGKYVFADLAVRTAPFRTDGRLFYADLTTGKMEEFLLPQFASGLVDGQTIHGFGQDGNGELYAFATAGNAASGGTSGIIYSIVAVPEPSAFVLLGLGLSLVGFARRRRVAS